MLKSYISWQKPEILSIALQLLVIILYFFFQSYSSFDDISVVQDRSAPRTTAFGTEAQYSQAKVLCFITKSIHYMYNFFKYV